MMENEAIYCLKADSELHSELCEECTLHGLVGCDHCQTDAIDVAIKALEEVQQYRKHGVTLESALNNMCDLAAAENLIEEYRAIGTPEECRAAMEKQPVFNMDKVVEQLQKISDEAHDLIMVSDSPQYYDGYEDGVDKAIDIVKAGGVDGN